jgi:hypothetical protein
MQLSWKDRFDAQGRGIFSEARASREIGGRYEIIRDGRMQHDREEHSM